MSNQHSEKHCFSPYNPLIFDFVKNGPGVSTRVTEQSTERIVMRKNQDRSELLPGYESRTSSNLAGSRLMGTHTGRERNQTKHPVLTGR